MNKQVEVVRLTADQRQSVIEEAAVEVANKKGLQRVNYKTVANHCSVDTSSATVRRYFGTKERLILLVLNSHLKLEDSVVTTATSMGYEVNRDDLDK